jgi:hypothetical protein
MKKSNNNKQSRQQLLLFPSGETAENLPPPVAAATGSAIPELTDGRDELNLEYIRSVDLDDRPDVASA